MRIQQPDKVAEKELENGALWQGCADEGLNRFGPTCLHLIPIHGSSLPLIRLGRQRVVMNRGIHQHCGTGAENLISESLLSAACGSYFGLNIKLLAPPTVLKSS